MVHIETNHVYSRHFVEVIRAKKKNIYIYKKKNDNNMKEFSMTCTCGHTQHALDDHNRDTPCMTRDTHGWIGHIVLGWVTQMI